MERPRLNTSNRPRNGSARPVRGPRSGFRARRGSWGSWQAPRSPQEAQYCKFYASGSEAQYRTCDAATLCRVGWAQFRKVYASRSRLNTVNRYAPAIRVWSDLGLGPTETSSLAAIVSCAGAKSRLHLLSPALISPAADGRTMGHKNSAPCSTRLSRPPDRDGPIPAASVALLSRIFRASRAGLGAPGPGRLDPVVR